MNLLARTLERIGPLDAGAAARAKDRLDRLTMPHWALGRLMDLALEMAAMTGKDRPPFKNKTVVVMAADHGVAAEGVSKYPREVTAQMVHNFVRGGAGINAIARSTGARVVVADLGVASELDLPKDKDWLISRRIRAGTGNMAEGPAMSREEAVFSVEAGIEIAESLSPGTDLFGTGDMGIANTTPSAAIAAVLTGRPPGEIAGNGTGLEEEQRRRKVSVIQRSIALNRPDPKDGLDVLAKVGGFEIGGIAGLILGAASRRIPVLMDGFISTAAALIARSLSPLSMGYVIASHRSEEKGHGLMLEHLGKKPLLDLGLRLG
ncbi:MAG: nicotinate-nucleotide--dimethylbenzimidazole phosphoribosyltransferase, partial [Elusimicrobia bacterium RIFCSPLOWO2_01_FULL_64_13]